MLAAFRQGLVCLTLLVTPLVAIAQQAPDPLFGMRKLNLARSTFPWSWARRSAVLAYEAADDAMKATWTGTRAVGTASTIRFAAKFDGKDYPAVGSLSWDSIALTRIDWPSVEAVRKEAASHVETLQISL